MCIFPIARSTPSPTAAHRGVAVIAPPQPPAGHPIKRGAHTPIGHPKHILLLYRYLPPNKLQNNRAFSCFHAPQIRVFSCNSGSFPVRQSTSQSTFCNSISLALSPHFVTPLVTATVVSHASGGRPNPVNPAPSIRQIRFFRPYPTQRFRLKADYKTGLYPYHSSTRPGSTACPSRTDRPFKSIGIQFFGAVRPSSSARFGSARPVFMRQNLLAFSFLAPLQLFPATFTVPSPASLSTPAPFIPALRSAPSSHHFVFPVPLHLPPYLRFFQSLPRIPSSNLHTLRSDIHTALHTSAQKKIPATFRGRRNRLLKYETYLRYTLV